MDVAVSPNPSVAAMQNLQVFQINGAGAGDFPKSLRPPQMSLHRKQNNTASSSIMSAPGDTQSLLQSIHSRVIEYNERERERERSRSNS